MVWWPSLDERLRFSSERRAHSRSRPHGRRRRADRADSGRPRPGGRHRRRHRRTRAGGGGRRLRGGPYVRGVPGTRGIAVATGATGRRPGPKCRSCSSAAAWTCGIGSDRDPRHARPDHPAGAAAAPGLFPRASAQPGFCGGSSFPRQSAAAPAYGRASARPGQPVPRPGGLAAHPRLPLAGDGHPSGLCFRQYVVE